MGLKNVIYLGAFSLFVVIVWVIMGVYHARTLSNISKSTQRKAAPITPTFDTETINQLKQRKSFQVNLNEQISLPTVAPQSFSSTISTSSGTTEESELIEETIEPTVEPDNQL